MSGLPTNGSTIIVTLYTEISRQLVQQLLHVHGGEQHAGGDHFTDAQQHVERKQCDVQLECRRVGCTGLLLGRGHGFASECHTTRRTRA